MSPQNDADILHKIDMALDISLRAKGAVMLTASGNIINPLNPEPVTIEEIAHTLSFICRYGGHCPKHYSVAKHSILVSLLGDQTGDLPRLKLLHDAHETYFGDWPKPIKNSVPALVEVEDRVEACVRPALHMPLRLPPEVKKCDLLSLAIEMRWLWANRMPDDPAHAAAFMAVRDLSMEEARDAFLRRYEEVRHTAPSSDDTRA